MDSNPQQSEKRQFYPLKSRATQNPASFLTRYIDQVRKSNMQAKNIQNQARRNSKTLNFDFKKNSEKFGVQAVYIRSSNISNQLHQMKTKINTNKYQMIIEVKNKTHLKKKNPNVDIKSDKQEQFFNQVVGKGLDTTKPVFSLFQPYNQSYKGWKSTSAKNHEKLQQLFRDTQQKIRQSRQNIKHKISLDTDEYYQQTKDQKIESKLFTDSEDTKIFNDVNNNSYQLIFQQIGKKMNEDYAKKDRNKMIQDANKKFKRKFLRCQQNKHQNILNRIKQDRSTSELTHFSLPSPAVSQFSFFKQSKSSQRCQAVYHTQNRLLKQSIDKGMSPENAKKMVSSFNNIIVDMKVYQEELNVYKRISSNFNTIEQLSTKSGVPRKLGNRSQSAIVSKKIKRPYLRASTSFSQKSKTERTATITKRT